MKPSTRTEPERENELALGTIATFHGLSWVLIRPAYAALVLLLLLVGGLVSWHAGTGGMVAIVIGLVLFALPTRIQTGLDGVSLRWLWVRRFISYEEIEHVTCYDEVQMGRWREIGLRIGLRSGTLYLPMAYHDRLAFWRRDPGRDAELARAWLSFHWENALLNRTAPQALERSQDRTRGGRR
jgi:hypothetical protein